MRPAWQVGRLALALATSAVVAVPAPCLAAPPHAGALDESFGRGGRIVFKLRGERMRPGAIAVDSSGRILVAGHLTDSPTEWPASFYGRALVVRFLPDGRPDPAFGEGGVARIRLARQVKIDGLAVQPDGALLLGGTALGEPGQDLAAVVRLLPSGDVDQAFGSDGLAAQPGENVFPSVTALPHIGVQRDGRIVAAGSQRPYDVHDSADPYILRLLPDGSPDPSFDGNGTARAGTRHPTAVLPLTDGPTLVAGWDEEFLGPSSLTGFLVDPAARDFPCCSGLPRDVWRTYPFKRSIAGVGAAAQADGSTVIAGGLGASRGRRFLGWVRIAPNLDLLDRGRTPSSEGVAAATFDSRGAILTIGSQSGRTPFSIQRYRGRRFGLDRSFGDARGQVDVELKDPARLIGMAIEGDKLVVAGTTSNPLSQDERLTLIRLHARQDGSGPIVTITGLPHRRCVDGPQPLLIRIRDESRTRTTVRLDGRRIRTTRRQRIHLTLSPTHLNPGRHSLTIRSRDAAGNAGAREAPFRTCG